MIFDCHNVPRRLDPAVDLGVGPKHRSGYFVRDRGQMKGASTTNNPNQTGQGLESKTEKQANPYCGSWNVICEQTLNSFCNCESTALLLDLMDNLQ